MNIRKYKRKEVVFVKVIDLLCSRVSNLLYGVLEGPFSLLKLKVFALVRLENHIRVCLDFKGNACSYRFLE